MTRYYLLAVLLAVVLPGLIILATRARPVFAALLGVP